jgi:hypothetical protein
LFGNGKKINKCREKKKRKGLRENDEIEYPKQRKSNIINKLNNIILYWK